MAYVDLTTILNPASGITITSAWGDQIRDNFEFLARVPACSVYHSTTQSVNSGSAPSTVLVCDSEQFDNASMHSTSVNTSRITIPIAGNYRISGTIQWVANATGNRGLQFLLNGTTNYPASHIPGMATNTSVLNGTRTLNLIAGDYIEICAWQTSGGALNVTVQDFCVELVSL